MDFENPHKKFDDAVGKIADNINATRRAELTRIFTGQDGFLQSLKRMRDSGEYEKGNKSGSMRKLASMPLVVDQFFTDLYGEDYYKDPDFFTKRFQEWAVVDTKKL